MIDNIYAEPLHNGNNAWQQLQAHILTHSNGKSSIPSSCTDGFLIEFPEFALALHLATLKKIGATRLYKKVKKWCAQGRKENLLYWQRNENHVSQVYASVASHFFSK